MEEQFYWEIQKLESVINLYDQENINLKKTVSQLKERINHLEDEYNQSQSCFSQAVSLLDNQSREFQKIEEIARVQLKESFDKEMAELSQRFQDQLQGNLKTRLENQILKEINKLLKEILTTDGNKRENFTAKKIVKKIIKKPHKSIACFDSKENFDQNMQINSTPKQHKPLSFNKMDLFEASDQKLYLSTHQEINSICSLKQHSRNDTSFLKRQIREESYDSQSSYDYQISKKNELQDSEIGFLRIWNSFKMRTLLGLCNQFNKYI